MAQANTSGAPALAFQSTTFHAVMRDGKPWLRLPQIGVALEYANPYKVQQVYERNQEEFTDRMTAVVKLDSAGGAQDTRIFSLRGAHLLAMFARTAKAAEFRRWVLDVLDREVEQPAASAPASNSFTVQPSDKLSQGQQLALRTLLEANVKKLPHSQQARAMVEGWSKLKAHFGVSYRDIPAERFVEAMSIMARHVASFAQAEPVELKPVPSAELTRRAFALSAEIGRQVQQSVFEAVLAGDEPGDCLRWIFSLDLDRGNSHTVNWLAPIEHDAVVMSLPQLSRAIGNGDLTPCADDLIALMSACTSQISRRMQASLTH